MAESMARNSYEPCEVQLYVYDLSKGMATMMPDILLGRPLEGIWHTGIFVYGHEHFFGPQGIQILSPKRSDIEEPDKKESLGITFMLYPFFYKYIESLAQTEFAPETYHLFKHNCNTFSNAISRFLVGESIPSYILRLPDEILQNSLVQLLLPLIEKFASSATSVFTNRQWILDLLSTDEPVYSAIDALFRPPWLPIKEEKKDRKKKKDKKKKHKSSGESGSESSISGCVAQMAEECRIVTETPKKKKDKSSRKSGNESKSAGPNYRSDIPDESNTLTELSSQKIVDNQEMLPSERVLQMEAEDKEEIEVLKKQREPPIIFRDLKDANTELAMLTKLLTGKVNDTDMLSLDELHQYILESDGSWTLSDNFLNLVGRVFYYKSLDSEARVCLLNILAIAALFDDVILLLHQDRRDHTIMNFAYDIDRHPLEEQLPLAQFIANLFENLSSSEWLMYISEWQHNSQVISNIRVTTKVAVHSLLSECEDLQICGIAIIHNLACKEVKTVVFDDVAVELTMALLQYFNGNPAEEQLYNCMKSLARFTQISGQEVPQLIQMIGPEPVKFRGCSQRVDELIDEIHKKLRI